MDKKELIRKAAVKIMAQKGFYNTKTAEIAREADVAVGTIYNYFKNKEDILDYIFKYELEKRLENLKKTEQQNLSFWEKLENFLKFHFKDIKENIYVGKILVKEKEFSKRKDSDSINKYLNMIPIILKKKIDEAIQKEEIKESYDSDIIANVIFGSIQGIVERAINSENEMMLDKAPEELIRLLKKGLV